MVAIFNARTRRSPRHAVKPPASSGNDAHNPLALDVEQQFVVLAFLCLA